MDPLPDSSEPTLRAPAPLFFTGGSALRDLSARLVALGRDSVHLVTPFDSGGSSAALRHAFRMPAVGDLRNRLMALADPAAPGASELHALLSLRLPVDEPPEPLRSRLGSMASGRDPGMRALPAPVVVPVRRHLTSVMDALPRGFDLRNASIGNLVLAGAYLFNGRDLAAAVDSFAVLVHARGLVRPIVDDDLELAAELEDGRRLVGQHRITGRTEPPLTSPVAHISLCRPGAEEQPARPRITRATAELIAGASLICYPVGSFWSSLVATLLPDGVADAVAASPAPKVYVPNPPGTDPEEIGLGLVDKVLRLRAILEAGRTAAAPARPLLDAVLLDARHPAIGAADVDRLRHEGLDVLDAPLARAPGASRYDAGRLTDAILGLI